MNNVIALYGSHNINIFLGSWYNQLLCFLDSLMNNLLCHALQCNHNSDFTITKLILLLVHVVLHCNNNNINMVHLHTHPVIHHFLQLLWICLQGHNFPKCSDDVTIIILYMHCIAVALSFLAPVFISAEIYNISYSRGINTKWLKLVLNLLKENH